MTMQGDWRLLPRHEQLSGVTLIRQPWKPANPRNDHDHCEFCWDKFADYHVILTADEQEIRRRIVARGEEPDCWCARHAEGCIRAQQNMPCDIRLRADVSPESIANAVIQTFKL